MPVDDSELRALVTDLSRAASRALPQVDAVMKKGAQNVKDEMVTEAKGSRHFRQIAPTISYDRLAMLRGVGYEVGPDRDRGAAAGLAGAYFGWPGGGGGTLDIDGPLRNEGPRMLKALGDLTGGLL